MVSRIRCIGFELVSTSSHRRVNESLHLGLTFPFICIRRKEHPKTVVAAKNICRPAPNRCIRPNSTKIYIPAGEACVTEVPEHELTQLLRGWSEGDEQALEKLM